VTAEKIKLMAVVLCVASPVERWFLRLYIMYVSPVVMLDDPEFCPRNVFVSFVQFWELK
jgi:hypothetical protein